MLCSKCGHENEDNAKFCNKCGSSLDQLKDTDDSTVKFILPVLKEEEEVAVEVKPQKEPVLVVAKGPMVGQRFSLNREQVSLGRDPGSDIFLNDITVSRSHAIISVKPEGITISDVGSLNGTYVNQDRIENSALKHGDKLQIGKFKLIFLAKET